MIASFVEKVLFLASLLIMSRYLSLADFGRFSFASYFGYTFAVLAEFGLYTILVKHLIERPQQHGSILAQALLLRIPLTGLALLTIAITQLLARFDPEQTQLLWLVGMSHIIFTLGFLGSSVFRATGRFGLDALYITIRSVLYATTMVVTAMSGFSVVSIAWAILIVNSFGACISIALALYITHDRFQWPGFSDTHQIMRDAAPLALSLLISTLFANFSIFILRINLDDTIVGWYNSAHVLVSNLAFLPELAMAILLPSMVAESQDVSRRGVRLTETMLLMVTMSLPISIGTSLLAPEIMVLLFGEPFFSAAGALSILIWTLPFSFLNFGFMMYFSSRGMQKFWLLYVILGIICIVISMLLLMPNYGFQGAAISRLLGEILVFALSIYHLRHNIHLSRLLSGLSRIAIATVALYGVTSMGATISLLSAIIFGGIIYIGILAFLGPWSLDQWRRL
jgi:O-antigen/teichoic acid export membrane protein